MSIFEIHVRLGLMSLFNNMIRAFRLMFWFYISQSFLQFRLNPSAYRVYFAHFLIPVSALVYNLIYSLSSSSTPPECVALICPIYILALLLSLSSSFFTTLFWKEGADFRYVNLQIPFHRKCENVLFKTEDCRTKKQNK